MRLLLSLLFGAAFAVLIADKATNPLPTDAGIVAALDCRKISDPLPTGSIAVGLGAGGWAVKQAWFCEDGTIGGNRLRYVLPD